MITKEQYRIVKTAERRLTKVNELKGIVSNPENTLGLISKHGKTLIKDVSQIIKDPRDLLMQALLEKESELKAEIDKWIGTPESE